MEKYFLLIYLSIFKFIINISITDSDGYLYDMEYSKEYIINMTSFPDGRIPYFAHLYFRLQVNPKYKNAITIKVIKDEHMPTPGVYFFSQKPNDNETKTSWGSSSESFPVYTSITNDIPYLKYIYELKEIHNEKYMVIRFSGCYNTYLSVFVSSYKEKQWLDLKEIKYNQEFVIKNVNNYKNSFMFWMKLQNRDDNTIRIKLLQNDTNEFSVFFEEFTVNPSKGGEDPINPRYLTRYNEEKENNTDIIKYYYNYYNVREGTKYIIILFNNAYNLNYFSIGVGKNITDYVGSNTYLKIIPLKYAIFALLLLIL